MKFTISLICLSAVFGKGLDISRVYAIGDSYTDTGNVFELTKHAKPDPKYYFQGRFSNGPVWIERFETKLPSKPKVVSFAYAGATSNNAQFQDIAPDSRQQIENNLHNYYTNNKADFDKNLNKTLVSFSFAPNDLIFPNGDPKISIKNLVDSVTLLINTYPIPKILITVSNASPFLPETKKMVAAKGQEFIDRSTTLSQYWQTSIVDLRTKFPKTEFYTFDYQMFHREQISKPNPNTGKPWIQDVPCLTPKSNSTTTDLNVCPNPQDHIYWDESQITTDFHEQYFQYALGVLSQ